MNCWQYVTRRRGAALLVLQVLLRGACGLSFREASFRPFAVTASVGSKILPLFPFGAPLLPSCTIRMRLGTEEQVSPSPFESAHKAETGSADSRVGGQ